MIKFSRWLDNLYEPGTQFYLRGNKIADPNAGQQLAAWGGDLAGSVIAAPLVASTAAQIGAGLYNAAAPEALDIPGESLANLAALGAMGYGAYRGISRYNRIGKMAGLRERFADRVPINTAAPAAAVAVPVATAAAAAHRPSSDFPYFDPYAGASVAPPLAEPPPGSFTVNYDRPPAGMVAPPLVDGPPPFMGLPVAAVQGVAPATTSGFYGAADLNALSNPRFGAPLPATQLVPPPANILQDVLTATPILAPPVAPASVGKFASAVKPVTVEAFDPGMASPLTPPSTQPRRVQARKYTTQEAKDFAQQVYDRGYFQDDIADLAKKEFFGDIDYTSAHGSRTYNDFVNYVEDEYRGLVLRAEYGDELPTVTTNMDHVLRTMNRNSMYGSKLVTPLTGRDFPSPIVSDSPPPASSNKSSRGVEPVTVEVLSSSDPDPFLNRGNPTSGSEPNWDSIDKALREFDADATFGPFDPERRLNQSPLVFDSRTILPAEDYVGLAGTSGLDPIKVIETHFNQMYGEGWEVDPGILDQFQATFNSVLDEAQRRTPISGKKSSLKLANSLGQQGQRS